MFWLGFKLFIIIYISLFLTPPSPLYSQGDSDTVRWHGRNVPRCSNRTVPWVQLKQCLQTNKQGASQSMEWFPDDCGDKQDTQVETCSRGGKCRKGRGLHTPRPANGQTCTKMKLRHVHLCKDRSIYKALQVAWFQYIATHRPPHRAVAVPGDWVAVALVLALQPRRQHQGHLHHQHHHKGHLHHGQQHHGHPPFSTINNGNTNTRAEPNTSPHTWQDEVQLAPWVPGGQGSSQRAPLQPAWQLQAPDFGSQNPPGHKNERWRDFYEAYFQVTGGGFNIRGSGFWKDCLMKDFSPFWHLQTSTQPSPYLQKLF